jgi:replicative DNA helicase Mcm
MTPDLQTEKWVDFLKRYYWDEIVELSKLYPEKRSLIFEFERIDQHDSTIEDMLLDDPDVTLESATHALRKMDSLTGVTLDEANLRVIKLPRTMQIKDIRSNDIHKLVGIEGIVTRVNEVRPRIVKAAFECPFCHHIFSVVQGTRQFKEPKECEQDSGGCGREVKHIELLLEHSKFVDTQRIQLAELLSEELELENSPQEIEVNLQDDLVGEVFYGNKIIVTGVLRPYQKKRKIVKTPLFDFCLDGNSIEHKEEAEEELSAENEKRIRRVHGRSIREIIRELEKEYGEEVPLEEILEIAEDEGMERSRAEEIIELMKREGIIYSPWQGILRWVE